MQQLVLNICGLCRARVFCVRATLEVLIVVMTVEMVLSAIFIFTETRYVLALEFWLPAHGLCLAV